MRSEYEPTGTSSSVNSQVPHDKGILWFLEDDPKVLSVIVCIESPFRGRGSNPITRRLDAIRNLRYARACLHNSLMRGESPFASHLLYTQPGVLNDTIPAERAFGIQAGLRFQEMASFVAVYIDRGITPGMEVAMKRARQNGKRVEMRSLHAPITKYEHDQLELGI